MLREGAWELWKNKVCRETGIDEADLSMILSRLRVPNKTALVDKT